jgi:hypothetical protein
VARLFFFDWRGGAHAPLLLLRVLQAALETLDLARRIDEALLTGEERVTRGTDVDVQILLG